MYVYLFNFQLIKCDSFKLECKPQNGGKRCK